VRPPQTLSAAPGLHRFLWDMHYAPVPGVRPDYPIAAVYRNTAPAPTSPWVVPGEYTVVLNAGGQSYTAPLNVKMDPRVQASTADLARQFELSKRLYDLWPQLVSIDERVKALNTALTSLRSRAPQGAVASQIEALSKQLKDLVGAESRAPNALPALGVLTRLETLFRVMQDVDAAPTTQVTAAEAEVEAAARTAIERWRSIESEGVPALNRQLQGVGLPTVEPPRP
jgi:hypothetical protein